MKILLKTTSLFGLALTVVPAFLVLNGSMTWSTHVVLMTTGTLLWFGTAPFWMQRSGGGD